MQGFWFKLVIHPKGTTPTEHLHGPVSMFQCLSAGRLDLLGPRPMKVGDFWLSDAHVSAFVERVPLNEAEPAASKNAYACFTLGSVSADDDRWNEGSAVVSHCFKAGETGGFGYNKWLAVDVSGRWWWWWWFLRLDPGQ